MIGLGKIIIENRQELINAAIEVINAVGKAIYEGFTGKHGGNIITSQSLLTGAGGIFGILLAVKIRMESFRFLLTHTKKGCGELSLKVLRSLRHVWPL